MRSAGNRPNWTKQQKSKVISGRSQPVRPGRRECKWEVILCRYLVKRAEHFSMRRAQKEAKNDPWPAGGHVTYIPFRRPQAPATKEERAPTWAKMDDKTWALPLASVTRARTSQRGLPLPWAPPPTVH